MEGLGEGRVVHLHRAAAGHCIPAIVVRVWGDTGMSNLRLFFDGSNDRAANPSDTDWATSVAYDETGEQENSWHWPERA